MSVETSYSRRHVTPPSHPECLLQPRSAGSNHSSCRSAGSHNSSPASIDTHLTTPPRSPRHHSNGPALLPKIRRQDQNLDPAFAPRSQSQHRTASLTSTGFPILFDSALSGPPVCRRSASPRVQSTSGALASNPQQSAQFFSATGAPQSRSVSPSSVNHSRNSSTSTLSESAIRKYICPSTRPLPSYLCSSSSTGVPTYGEVKGHAAASSLPLLAPSTQQPLKRPSMLPAELDFDSYAEPPNATSLLHYLTAPNPTPALVRYTPSQSRHCDMHYWWDIRNLRSWTDFNLEKIYSNLALKGLLESPIPEPALPTAPRCNLNPETTSALHKAYIEHYATKVNAALKVSLGDKHLTLRSYTQHPGARQKPDFVSNYDSDFELTIYGDGRGRIVGLVRSYNQWNTGMRSDGPSAQIEFLRVLALLHRFMREHNCRYGFIMTEIELVCVRAGLELVPHFGFVELSAPVQLNSYGPGKMTAGLALWYLHMLAKNQNLPGQCGWKIDVGTPVAQTRHKHLARDQWMLKPEGREKRDAKRNRGFVWPEEPLNRKECGKPKRCGKF